MTKEQITLRKFLSLTEYARLSIARGLGFDYSSLHKMEDIKSFFQEIIAKSLMDELGTRVEIYCEE